MKINWSQFKTIAFIDSNIALECLALEQLPWSEFDNTGPILVLVAPTVLQEVDAKKNHARLGDHARRFNRSMRPLLGEQSTVHVRQSPNPKVELALAACSRVDWSNYPTLDPDEPDSRIVAQALHVIGPPQSAIVVVSQDNGVNPDMENELAVALTAYISITRSYQLTERATKQNHFAVIRYGSTDTLRPFAMGGPPRHLIPANVIEESIQKVIAMDSQNHPDWIVQS